MRVRNFRGSLEQANRYRSFSRIELMAEADKMRELLATVQAESAEKSRAALLSTSPLVPLEKKMSRDTGGATTGTGGESDAVQWQAAAEQLQIQLEQTQLALQRERADAGAPRAMEPLSDVTDAGPISTAGGSGSFVCLRASTGDVVCRLHALSPSRFFLSCLLFVTETDQEFTWNFDKWRTVEMLYLNVTL